MHCHAQNAPPGGMKATKLIVTDEQLKSSAHRAQLNLSVASITVPRQLGCPTCTSENLLLRRQPQIADDGGLTWRAQRSAGSAEVDKPVFVSVLFGKLNRFARPVQKRK